MLFSNIFFIKFIDLENHTDLRFKIKPLKYPGEKWPYYLCTVLYIQTHIYTLLLKHFLEIK